MIGRYDAAINGTWISEIDDRIVVVDVDDSPKNRVVTVNRENGAGLRHVRTQRESLTVTIQFSILEQDVELRKDILTRVQRWVSDAANDVAKLEVNDRRGQLLYVRVSEIPSVGSAKWTDSLSIAFTAYEMPYWMDTEYTKVKTTENGTLFVPGFGLSFCEVDVVNDDQQPLASVSLAVGGSSIVFDGINLAAGEKLTVFYDHYGRMHALIGEASVLAKRTPASSDDLVALCGARNTVSVQADGSVSAVFKARGVYM